MISSQMSNFTPKTKSIGNHLCRKMPVVTEGHVSNARPPTPTTVVTEHPTSRVTLMHRRGAYISARCIRGLYDHTPVVDIQNPKSVISGVRPDTLSCACGQDHHIAYFNNKSTSTKRQLTASHSHHDELFTTCVRGPPDRRAV